MNSHLHMSATIIDYVPYWFSINKQRFYSIGPYQRVPYEGDEYYKKLAPHHKDGYENYDAWQLFHEYRHILIPSLRNDNLLYELRDWLEKWHFNRDYVLFHDIINSLCSEIKLRTDAHLLHITNPYELRNFTLLINVVRDILYAYLHTTQSAYAIQVYEMLTCP